MSMSLVNYPYLKNTTLACESSQSSKKEISESVNRQEYIQQFNAFSAELASIISKVLIERIFFQSTAISPELLLYLSNDLITILANEKKEKVDLFKETRLLWKQWRGCTLTKEEKIYINTPKEIDVMGEILNGMRLSSIALIGQELYSSIISVAKQQMWTHIPAIVGYTGTLLYGPRCISYFVNEVLQSSNLKEEQKVLARPWLTMIGRLALGFMPKVHANDSGVQYHYPSVQGSSKIFSHGQTITLHGEDLSIELEGQLNTPEGLFEGVYLKEFKLKGVYELSEECIRIQVIDAEGNIEPVQFTKVTGKYGPEIQVASHNQELAKHWARYFHPRSSRNPNSPSTSPCMEKLTEKALSSIGSINPSPLMAETRLDMTSSIPHQSTSDMLCSLSLTAGALLSLIISSPAPMIVSSSGCISPAMGTRLRHPAVREFLDKLQFGNLKAIDDGLKEHLIQLGEQDVDDDTLIDLVIDSIDKATSLLSNPVMWALEEFQQDLVKAGAQKGHELLAAMNSKKGVLDKASSKVSLDKIQSEKRQTREFISTVDDYVVKQNKYLDTNDELFERVEEYLNPQNLFNQYREQYQKIESEIRERNQNIADLRETIKELKGNIKDNWNILKEGYYPEDFEYAESYHELGKATDQAYDALEKGRKALQEQKALHADAQRRLTRLRQDIINGGDAADRKIRETYITLKKEVAEVREARDHNQRELKRANQQLQRLEEMENKIKNSLHDEL